MTTLLSATDPAPTIHAPGPSGWLLTVEHAGRAIPSRLGSLGLAQSEITRHIGWDPGALALAETLRPMLNATLIAQTYSRLVIDCNRPRTAPDLIPETADDTQIPGNKALTKPDRAARWAEIHAPFHATVAQALPCTTALLSIHSYDPKRHTDAAPRLWPVGLLWRQPNPLAERLAMALSVPFAPLGLNQPYEIEDAGDYTIPVHAEPRALPHVLVEVRNDLLASPEAITHIATLLASACMETV